VFGRHPDKHNRVRDILLDINLESFAQAKFQVNVIEREAEDGRQRSDHLLRILETPFRQSRDLLVVGRNWLQVLCKDRVGLEPLVAENSSVEIMAGDSFCLRQHANSSISGLGAVSSPCYIF
jgi:hypothetical protein